MFPLSGLFVLMVGAAVVFSGPGPVTNAPTPNPTDNRHVSLQHLTCARDSFAAHFHGGEGPGRNSLVGPSHVDVGWTSIKGKVDAVAVGTDTLRALRFHYGFKTSQAPHDFRFTMGIEVVRVVHVSGDDWTVLPVTNAFYYVDDQGQLQPTSASTWGDGAFYFQHGYVRRASTSRDFEALSDTTDTRSILFPWENELVPLHDDNAGCDSLRLTCIAEPAGQDDSDWRHHLCAVALNHGLEQVNNDPVVPGHPFENKAADVGCPCPNLCNATASFPVSGIPVRHCP